MKLNIEILLTHTFLRSSFRINKKAYFSYNILPLKVLKDLNNEELRNIFHDGRTVRIKNGYYDRIQ